VYLVSLTAIDGKVLDSKQISSLNKQLTLSSDLHSGMYIITIKGVGIVESKKIIIR